MLRVAGIVLLVTSAVAFGQVSTEEAQARLAARRSAETQPVQELADLRQIVATLRKENAELRAQVKQLSDELKSRPAAPKKKLDQGTDTDYSSVNFKGMTLEQADAAVGSKFRFIASNDGVKTLETAVRLPTKNGMGRWWDIVLYVENGKVSHFQASYHEQAIPSLR